MTDQRPDPDTLLQRVQAEEARQARGKLKIFFGAAPGVGKTYSMLEAAREAAEDGMDVVVGYIEPHCRPETQALVLGLDVLKRLEIDYRGTKLMEFSLEAALELHPQLILVDELAHTNAPGVTHTKRWQDVLRLLEAGIDVYTTLNVQHLESLNDEIARITGVVVRETVPDVVFEQADDVKLVDLAPDDLLERLREGKVYVPHEAERAVSHFFAKGNLIALRELALRRATDRVGEQMDTFRQQSVAGGPPPVRDRIMVCVGPGPFSSQLARAARRMAASLRVPWLAVHVETPADARQSAADRESLHQTFRLVEQLGGEVVTLSGRDPADELLAYAARRNVTKIVVGKPKQPWWKELSRGSLIYKLTRRCGTIDIYILSGDPHPNAVREPAAAPAVRSQRDYLIAAGVVALCTGLCALLAPHLARTGLAMLYLLGVVAVSLRVGRGPSILASILSVLAFDFFFVPPAWTFAVSDTQYLLVFAVMLMTGLIISTLTSQVQFQIVAARQRERRTDALYTLGRDLAASQAREQIARIAATQVESAADLKSAILLPDAGGKLEITAGRAEALSAHDEAVAKWVFEHGETAGRDSATLPGTEGLYLPLRTARGVVGVLGVYPGAAERVVDIEQMHLLEAFAGLIALAIQRGELEAEADGIRLDIETERLRNSLLSAVSHDLRTPLSVITGASSALMEEDVAIDPILRNELTASIFEEAERLNRLVANLLDMTRLQAGALKVHKEWQPIEEVIGAALGRLKRKLAQRNVTTSIAPDVPFVKLDGLLMQQVLMNLLENALRHTPEGTPIEIAVRKRRDDIVVEVADRGPGLPPGDSERLFDKFVRSNDKMHAGAGLGLAICRGIVQLHGGEIHAENRPDGGGASFRFSLPLEENPPEQPPEGEPPIAQA